MDEDVAVVIANLVDAKGFRAVTARDEGQLGKPDAEQLTYAVEHGFCVVTHNREDYEELHRQYVAEGRSHSGIIIAYRRRPFRIAGRLSNLLETITADEMRNQLLYI